MIQNTMERPRTGQHGKTMKKKRTKKTEPTPYDGMNPPEVEYNDNLNEPSEPMSKKNEKNPGQKHPGGAPPIYDPQKTPREAEKLCLLGHTDEELALVFEVDVSTISRWKNEHPEFQEALKRGKAMADANVASRLYVRAIGYEHDETDIRVVGGKIVKTQVRKYYPPDTLAAIYWLNNRQKGKWAQTTKQQITGPDGTKFKITITKPNKSKK